MTQFTRQTALQIFRENPEAKYVAQDKDGMVCLFKDKPYIYECDILEYWRDDSTEKLFSMDVYGEHPIGWQNSLYSRADFPELEE